jgi:hypothetical protein
MPQRTTSLAIIGAVCVAAIVGALFVPPLAQPLDYHEFADTRTLLGIPNFWNVMSNAPFLLVGILGSIEVFRNRYSGGLPSQRFAYGVFFVGIAAVCFGSGYYHWSPSNATLAWDRLPMAFAFMAFVSIVVSEHIDERIGRALLWPLIVVGVASVWHWDYTEALGRGDLRPYGLVQFLSLVVVALTWILIPSRLTGIGYLWAMFAGYALAKVLEEFDDRVYSLFGQQMSGHALKHLAAAAGMYCFVLALRNRRIAAA